MYSRILFSKIYSCRNLIGRIPNKLFPDGRWRPTKLQQAERGQHPRLESYYVMDLSCDGFLFHGKCFLETAGSGPENYRQEEKVLKYSTVDYFMHWIRLLPRQLIPRGACSCPSWVPRHNRTGRGVGDGSHLQRTSRKFVVTKLSEFSLLNSSQPSLPLHTPLPCVKSSPHCKQYSYVPK